MREIKFRAWEFVREVMIESFNIGVNVKTPNSKFHIMQYTGLKDKNGKEIYEGDILEIDGGAEEKPLAPVEFHEGRFVIHAPWLHTRNNHIELRAYTEPEFVHCEVTGNIYENPELTKTKIK